MLEAAGCEAVVPRQFVCCGRPLYDYGFLDMAKARLKKTLRTMEPYLAAGTPIVGLEPSCVAVFRDELAGMLPDDALGRKMTKQTRTLGEYLSQRSGFELPRLERKAVVQGHCHHKAVMTLAGDEEVMKRMGLDFQVLDSGCCGMAGSFGFEAGDHYDVAMKAGERVLLPAVRHAAGDTLVIADGFSCREQIEQGTSRQGLHLAEAIQMAMREGERGPVTIFPERGYVAHEAALPSKRALAFVAVGVAVAAVGALVARRRWLSPM
ncbi:MAG: heterodisulfide reductase-related iron-sulfur binding cluster [Myxococcales bacterium]